MSRLDDYIHALQAGDKARSVEIGTQMNAAELGILVSALKESGQDELARGFSEHARLRALGEAGVRIRIPLRQ